MNTDNTINPSDGAIILQPLVMAPAKTAYNITDKKLTSIRIFSIASIILGILSICLQISTTVMSTSRFRFANYPLDYVGHGIWCGCFYVAAGNLGVAACNKKTISLLVGTLVISSLSITGSIVASTLSGIMAGYDVSIKGCYYFLICDDWLALEWSLMTVSILAFFSSMNLALVSGPICCGMIKAILSNGRDTNNLLENVKVRICHDQQSIYFQPQPIDVAAQQQQETNAKFSFAGKQTQYPQQVLYPQLHA